MSNSSLFDDMVELVWTLTILAVIVVLVIATIAYFVSPSEEEKRAEYTQDFHNLSESSLKHITYWECEAFGGVMMVNMRTHERHCSKTPTVEYYVESRMGNISTMAKRVWVEY